MAQAEAGVVAPALDDSGENNSARCYFRALMVLRSWCELEEYPPVGVGVRSFCDGCP